MKQLPRTLIFTCGLILAGAVLTACEQEGPMERAGERTDRAIEDTGKAVEDAGDTIRDDLERR